MSGYVDLNDDEDENGQTKAGRPNAYWAQVREELEEARGGDSFTGSFRGVRPSPHGGAASVGPNDVIGQGDLCWCGRPAEHWWPGKGAGVKHPSEEQMKQMTATIDRRDLRAYHSRLQDFLLQCINTDGLRFRMAKNSVILYPPDNSQPMTVYARNADRQVRALQKWYLEHVNTEPEVEQEVDVEALAEAVNDPVEHPKKEFQPTEKVSDGPIRKEPPVAPGPEYDDHPADPKDYLPVDTGVPGKKAAEWVPWKRSTGEDHEWIETNGTNFRCRLCEDTDHPLTSDNPRSIGGHNRIYHTDTTNLYSPETRERATDTLRTERIKGQVGEAIQILIGATGYQPPVDTREVERLEKALAHAIEERDAATKRADDAEAKLALIREASSL